MRTIRSAIVAAFVLSMAGAANASTIAACSNWHAVLAAHHEAVTHLKENRGEEARSTFEETQIALATARQAVLSTVENEDAAATISQLGVAADAAFDAKNLAIFWAASLPPSEIVSQLAHDAWMAVERARYVALRVICPNQ